MLSLLIVLANVAVALYLYHHFVYKRKHLPPGPTPLPIIGNMLTIRREEPGDACFRQWRKQYGPIFTYWLGSLPIVCVADYATIVDTFQKDGDAYAGRFNFEAFNQLMRGGNLGVIASEGELWSEHRKFVLHFLRDFSGGKNELRERVLAEAATLLERVHADIDAGVEDHDIAARIDLAVGSVINTIVFGYRFTEGGREKEFYELKQLMTDSRKAFNHPLIGIFMERPMTVRRLPIFSTLYKRIVDASKALHGFFEARVADHVRELDVDVDDAPPTDLVEAFLREKARRDAMGGEHTFDMQQLMNTCADMWLAGQETTTTTLAWAVIYLVHHPDVQRKLHEELDAVVGSERLVTLSDRPNMPYTCAVVNEAQRCANILPQNIMHRTTRDVTVHSHFLPKGTCVMPQISAVLHDERIYADPSRFDPRRFLDANGALKRADELIPFGIGKRQCLGEAIARMELFLFTANIFNHFTVSSGKKAPSTRREFGAVVYCCPYTCKMEKRHQ